MKKLFGTDGVRGRANQPPMTCETALAIGRAVTRYFQKGDAPARVVIGKDTRASGDMIEAAVAAGVCSAGGDALLTGVLPTPAIARSVIDQAASAGVVISASHNPYFDNGIKVFGPLGFKLNDDREAAIEAVAQQQDGQPGPDPGRVVRTPDAGGRYVDFLLSLFPKDLLRQVRVAMDCSNGATFSVAPKVFARLGADVRPLAVSPDGVNINADCGSQHPQVLQETVVRHQAAFGFAYDGDGDRCIAVDELGRPVSGDKIICILARYLQDRGKLANNTVVTTVMSNIGLKKAMRKAEINHLITDVGDRYVLEGMQEAGAVLGGEDSGHVIDLANHTTGDGVLTSLLLARAVRDLGRPLSELADAMEVFPQVLINVEVSAKPPLEDQPLIQEAILEAENQLGEDGRVLVRYSGTRGVCRVMVEGPTRRMTNELAEKIAETIREVL